MVLKVNTRVYVCECIYVCHHIGLWAMCRCCTANVCQSVVFPLVDGAEGRGRRQRPRPIQSDVMMSCVLYPIVSITVKCIYVSAFKFVSQISILVFLFSICQQPNLTVHCFSTAFLLLLFTYLLLYLAFFTDLLCCCNTANFQMTCTFSGIAIYCILGIINQRD